MYNLPVCSLFGDRLLVIALSGEYSTAIVTHAHNKFLKVIFIDYNVLVYGRNAVIATTT